MSHTTPKVKVNAKKSIRMAYVYLLFLLLVNPSVSEVVREPSEEPTTILEGTLLRHWYESGIGFAGADFNVERVLHGGPVDDEVRVFYLQYTLPWGWKPPDHAILFVIQHRSAERREFFVLGNNGLCSIIPFDHRKAEELRANVKQFADMVDSLRRFDPIPFKEARKIASEYVQGLVGGGSFHEDALTRSREPFGWHIGYESSRLDVGIDGLRVDVTVGDSGIIEKSNEVLPYPGYQLRKKLEAMDTQ